MGPSTSTMRQKSEAIAKAKRVIREHSIDKAMTEAEAVYKQGVSQRDPYAMHKAVESLPVPVLVSVLARLTAHELQRPNDQPGDSLERQAL